MKITTIFFALFFAAGCYTHKQVTNQLILQRIAPPGLYRVEYADKFAGANTDWRLQELITIKKTATISVAIDPKVPQRFYRVTSHRTQPDITKILPPQKWSRTTDLAAPTTVQP